MSTDILICGVCGRSVHPDDNHAVIDVTLVRPDAPDSQEDYALHERCRQEVFGGWRTS